MFDVIVIGGSYAGISASIQLGRARRTVLIIDGDRRRNRFAAHSHGFLGQDGEEAATVAAKGRSEALAYPTIRWQEGTVTSVRTIPGGFAVQTAGDEHQSKRLILATGVVDELPEVPGLAERWGKTVFHCPYCHGYELNLGRLGVLATSPLSLHSAALVSQWAAPGQTTLFVNEAFEPDAEQLAGVVARGIHIEPTKVAAIEGDAPRVNVRLVDGRIAALDGLFVVSRTHVHSSFAEQLGCELDAGPVGTFYKADPMTKETTVPGVFACGDAGLPMGSVAFAVADGMRAGVGAHASLVFR